MEIKKLYRDDGEFAIVEENSQAEKEFLEAGWSDKEPKAKKAVKNASV